MAKGYFVRYFGTGRPPRMSEIEIGATRLLPGLEFDPREDGGAEIWHITEKGERDLCGLLLVDTPEAEIFATEISEFLDALNASKDKGDREAVEKVLAGCTFILSILCLFSDRTMERTRTLLDPVIKTAAEISDGLFQADDEGFYRDGKLIMPLA
jgi:hypothetical protein